MAAAIEVGATLDGFRIEERLHSGGMSVLYRVSGPEGGAPLLMKVPRLGHGEPASNLISFEVEQMVLGALEGPHVPRLVAKGDLSRSPYLVMERVEGRSLQEWAARAPLPAAEVARAGVAVAEALHAIHLQDAIHLDVKPSNVILRPDGRAVLVDFGLAHHGHFPDLFAEEYRRPIGSAPYLSPEQVVGVRSDPRSDLFSLGVLLYELATGRYPFGRPTTIRGLHARLWRPPVPPRAVVADIPEWLQEVILHCLEVEAGERYPSASQVAFDLANAEQIAVGERGRRHRAPGRLALLRRWVRAAGYEPAEIPRPSAAVARGSIVLAAIASHQDEEARAEALREAVRGILAGGERTRLAVLTVVRPTPGLGGSTDEETAARQRLRHLVLLRHWAEPLRLAAPRLSFHVVESSDPAEAILAYARANRVDHVVIGAPPGGAPASGTVAGRVAVAAPCSVTVVRARSEG